MRLLLVFILNLISFFLTGQTGKALYLDGDGDYMMVADQSDLDIESLEEMTVTCRVKCATATDFYRIISKRGGTSGSAPGYEMIVKSGTGEFGINLRSTTGVNLGPPFSVKKVCDGNWHHVAMVFSGFGGSTATIYVDGQFDQTVSNTTAGTFDLSNATNFFVGSSSTGAFFWNGWIDDVRIRNYALFSDEISQDMITTITQGENGLVAAWNFEEVQGQTVPDLTGQHPGTLFGNAQILDASLAVDMAIASVPSLHPDIPCGRGNTGERLAAAVVKTNGEANPLQISGLKFRLNSIGTAGYLSGFRLWWTGNQSRLNPATAVDLGQGTLAQDIVSFQTSRELASGDNFFWLTSDISSDAPEGHEIGATAIAYTTGGQEILIPDAGPYPTRTVLLEHQYLFSGGDYNSASYRIPAITSRGQRVVAVADARRNNNGDLPGNIDIIARHSDDMGHTWSDPVIIADFGNSGASDPAIVYDRVTGDMICMFASHNGLFASTPSNKIRFQVSRSSDMGLTWSAPQEHSADIYLPGWYAAWVASGSAHQLPGGRIVAAIGVRQNSGNTISNFMIYSDDSGNTWQTSPGQASPAGDEAKIVSLDNNDLLMAIRSPGARKVTRSHDGGATWDAPVAQPELVEPGVNGDLIRYTSVKDGYDKSRLLFSVPNHVAQRRNLNVFVSYDEGNSWPVKRAVCPGPSAYSALTTFDDGSIGLFYENGEYENYQLCFARFSLDWLSSGTDTWTAASASSEPALYNGFGVAPNPAKGNIRVTIPPIPDEKVSVDILNYSGKVVKTLLEPAFITETRVISWDAIKMTPGTYFVRMSSSKGVATRKVFLCE